MKPTFKTANQETAEEKIKQEETKDLINIHNFLSSVVMGKGNLSVFELWIKLQDELESRQDAKTYLNAMDKLTGAYKLGIEERV